MIKEAIMDRPRLYDLINVHRPFQSSLERCLDKFSRSHEKVRFLQIGASDGLRWDSARRFIVRDGWEGVLVEPLPGVFEMLKSNYAYLKQRLVFVNAAVSSESGCLKFWCASKDTCSSLPKEEALRLLRQSSLDKSFVERRVGSVECCDVQCLTVQSIVDEYWKDSIDILLVDAEGHDADIIMSIDFARLSPEAIVYESHNLGLKKEPLERHLKSVGYSVSTIDGDSVAVR